MKQSDLGFPGQMTFDELMDPPPPCSASLPAPPRCRTPDTPPGEPSGGMTGSLEPGTTSALAVEVIRSPKRRKTAQARLVGSTVEIRIPAHCSGTEEAELVDHFRAKFERSRAADALDLTRRATELGGQYGLPEPTSIRWVSNQRFRWGSCTPADGSIRLSDRMTEYPSWVIDYVIVHELAHLVVENHSTAFWELVDEYPLTERARGYLLAMAQAGS